MFEFKKKDEIVEETGFVQHFLNAGIHLIHFNKVEVVACSNDKTKIRLYVEGPAVSEDFEGAEKPDGTKAKGLVNKAWLSAYPKDFNIATEAEWLMNSLSILANKAGVLEALLAEKYSSLDALIEGFEKAMTDKSVWLVLKGEDSEYNGKVYTNLSIKEVPAGKTEAGKSKFQPLCKEADFAKEVVRGKDGVETLGTVQGLKFDPSSPYDWKRLETPDEEDFSGEELAF